MPVVLENNSINMYGTTTLSQYDKYSRDTEGTTNNLVNEPVLSTAHIDISSGSLGESHTIFLDGAGRVYSAGLNTSGQLGLADTTERRTPVPISYFNNIPIAAIFAGIAHTIFLDTIGKVYAVGAEGNGRIATAGTVYISTPFPITYFNTIPIKTVAAGNGHTIFVSMTGIVYSVGLNANGQLGTGNLTNISTPAPITFFNNIPIKSVAAGEVHTLFLSMDGKVYSTGFNTSGQLGLGDTTQRTTPVLIPYFNKILISAIYAGSFNSIFVDTAGKIYAVGANGFGQLGLGNIANRITPEPITYFNNIKIAYVSTKGDNTLFLDTDGKVYGAGLNENGELGLGDVIDIYTPIPIPYFNNIPLSFIQLGRFHSIFVDISGKVYTSGFSGNGQLGMGTTYYLYTPLPITYFNATPVTIASTTGTGADANHKLFTISTTGFYLLSFPRFTIVNINNDLDIALNGNYKIVLSQLSLLSSIRPFINNALKLTPISPIINISSFVIKYHLRIPTYIQKQITVDTVKSDLYLRDTVGTTSNLTIEPTITSTATPQLTPEILYFKHKRTANVQDSYTITFSRDTICDILIVGGGGAGGTTGAWYEAGAGGGGGIVYMVNKVLNGTYTILVGKGGDSSNGGDSEIRNTSTNTAIVFDSISLIGKGGGRGGNGTGTVATSAGLAGGSGGGNAMYTNIAGGLATQGNTFWDGTQYVQGGFNGSTGGNSAPYYSGAGGGAGAVGSTIYGGNGRLVSINGINQFYGGGGASYGGAGTAYSDSVNTGGLGGGGKSGGGTAVGERGTNDLGGGGGAATSSTAGTRTLGGSGIVIIRAYNNVIDKNILTFRHSEQNVNQTGHALTLTKRTVCDVLLVGGGGGGGGAGGSGGGGAVVTFNDVSFPQGIYTMIVGWGGMRSIGSNDLSGSNGNNSSIEGNGIVLRAAGGGGGGKYNNNAAPTPPSVTYTNPLTNVVTTSQGGGGGVRFNSLPYAHNTALSGKGGINTDNNAETGGAGGGAASEANGGNGGNSTKSGSTDAYLGNGGLGIVSSISGVPKEYGGGGAGARWNSGFTNTFYGIATGGGGYNEFRDINNKNYILYYNNGVAGTGGGGSSSSRGGSGIIIVKIKSVIEAFYHTPHIKNLNHIINSSSYPSIAADATNLIAWYKFDGNSNDSNSTAIKHNFTTLSGTIAYGKDAIINKQYLTLANGTLSNSTLKLNGIAFSISWLLRVYNYEEAYYFILSGSQTTNNVLFIGVRGDVGYVFGYWGNDLESDRKYYEDINQWVFMTYTVEANNNRKMYRNGVLFRSDTNTSAQTGTSNIELRITRVDLCDMRVYNKALSQQEITSLYNGYMANTFTVNFPTRTIANINNTGDKSLNSVYNISVAATESTMISTLNPNFQESLYFNSSNIAINYHLLNPIKDPKCAQWTYNTSNANVYHMGNVGVGIGNTMPTNTLHVIGNTHSTTYSAGKKTFKIDHPLKIKKWLYHGCIECPRFDNIYRGKKRLINGKAEVDIDRECNTTGGMTPGTFTALNTNYQLYLQNNETYDIVKGKINGSIINILCENTTDELEIDWLVVGERHDEHVIYTKLTDFEGNLICEHDMTGADTGADKDSDNIPITNVDIVDIVDIVE
jgi:alpha-tubulin suppressor-like RCC1 family protein